MDLSMPDIDGLSAARHIRGEPHLRQVPIVIISAYDMVEFRAEAVSVGCSGYFIKPFDADQFKTIIDSTLNVYSTSRNATL